MQKRWGPALAPLLRLAQQGDVEQEGDRQRQEPPRRHAGRRERGRDAQRSYDPGRDAPVVADDEVPPELAEAAQRRHAIASLRRRRKTETNPNEINSTKTSTPGSAASPPGQSTPVPSAAQKMPNVVNIVPTANFNVFSGTRDSGCRATAPSAATSTTATPAPTAASAIDPCALPNVRTMNATSRPSSKTPLNAIVNAYQSSPARRSSRAARASAVSCANASSSSWSAL